MPPWLQVLHYVGYPREVVVLDFETYYDTDYGLKDLSIVEYVHDPRFEVLALARIICRDNYPPYEQSVYVSHGETEVKNDLRWLCNTYGPNLQGCTVVAQNAPFDCGILRWVYGINPRWVIDTAALARHWDTRSRHSLDALVKRFGFPEKGDTAQFKGFSYRPRWVKPTRGKCRLPYKAEPTATEEWATKMNQYAANDAAREWEIFTTLLPRLSNPKTEIKLQEHTLQLFLHPRLKVDRDKGSKIIEEMFERMDQACGATGYTSDEISKDSSFEAALYNFLKAAGDDPARYQKPAKTKAGWKFAIAKDDIEREVLENHESEDVRNLMAARAATSSWPLHIGRVQRLINQSRPLDGYLPVPLKYHGAHTGRWSGDQKINLQNLGSRGDPLISSIRNMLVAAPGRTLVIADSAQIEARVVAWFAGESELLQAFENGDDVYCLFAEQVVGRPVRKPRPHDIEPVAKQLAHDRNIVGKPGVLGCGYGMGASKLDSTYQLNDPDLAETIVQTYRNKYTNIVQFWHKLERVFAYVARFPHAPVQLAGRKLHLYARQDEDVDVVIRLPNGRELKYHKVRVKQEHGREVIEVYNAIENRWAHIWGGHLTENVVQAASRDVLAEAFLRFEAQATTQGIDSRVALHVHDEIVADTDESVADKALQLALDCLVQRPEWAPDLPLDAEGCISERYQK